MVREKWGVQLALCLCFKVSTTWKYLSWHQNPLFLVLWPMVDNLFDFLTAIHILQPSRLLISRQLNVKTWMFLNMSSQTLRALNQSNFIRLSLGTFYVREYFVLNFSKLFELPKVLILMVPKNVSNGRRTKDKFFGKVKKLETRRK